MSRVGQAFLHPQHNHYLDADLAKAVHRRAQSGLDEEQRKRIEDWCV
jgi:hypothetical protein